MTVKRYFFVFATNKIIILKCPSVMTTLRAPLSQITVFTSIVRGTENRMFVNIKFNEKNATQKKDFPTFIWTTSVTE